MEPPELKAMRKMSTERLCKYIAGWSGRESEPWALLGRHELERRLRRPDAVRSWIAIVISIVSLLVSVLVTVAHISRR
jgi:hypothetical protein